MKQRSDISVEHKDSIIGFVWRPEELNPSVIQMAQRTGSRAVFDFSMIAVEGLRSFLQKMGTSGLVRDIKISVSAFLDPSLGQLLKETGVQAIWIECHPLFFQRETSLFLHRLRELSEDLRCFPIIGDRDILTALLKEEPGIDSIVLKGCEASGFVSSETTMSLYSLAKEIVRTRPEPPDLLLWGGVSTSEAAAAFLSTGAAGIVFESIHWLTDMVAIDDVQRQRLSKLRLDSTELLGLDLQIPCRLFNKGNSLAFKEIKTFEDSLYGAKIKEESRRSFVSLVHARALHPLESHFGQDEVIPLGVETAFAAAFAERFGSGTEKAVKTFMDEIRNVCRMVKTKKGCYIDSPVAREMGTRYPFIQGAMSWISDVPEFASRVADAGGLPTIALGLMDAETLDRRLGRLPEIMAGRPYAVNVVSLVENPFREIHLAWIKKTRPRFVVIAGGDLSPLRQLIECGISVIYIAPDEALLRIALEAGVRYVVCEGYEAGGHVGQHSTLTLAQMVLDLKRRTPALFHNCRVILAGGIFNRETALMAAVLGADAVQMGTAYLATEDIVETKALTALYQRMVLNPPAGGTVVSGQATGLRVRSLRTPRVEAILSLEREFAAGHQDEASFRNKMEKMAAGSLFAAARGMDKPGGAKLDEQACLERGQFMSGACAGLIRKVKTLQSFHHELAEGTLSLHQPFEGATGNVPEPAPSALTYTEPVRSASRQIAAHKDVHDRIAVTGMSAINALGNSPEEIWTASLAMKSGISLVPDSRWDHSLFYDLRPHISDKTYCKVGAFMDFHISRNELGIPPQDFRTMTSATKLTLWLAERAIQASGILESDIPRERIGVIVSQNSGEAAGTLTNIIIRAYAHDILSAVQRAVQLTPDQMSAIEREVKAGRMSPDDTTLLGRLNCAAPGFICNRYGFMGPSYAVSAACATSLVALYSAMQLIRNGIIDAAVVGGAEDDLTHLHFLEFAAVGALYGMSGRERPAHETSRPFDAERDGMVLGEGGGMIVIERESIARTRGANIHSIITGMGASNNHLGMVESNSATQELAIRASFHETPYGPDAVELVECHATSTRQGDVEEVRALKRFFSPSGRTVLTSFKSQIGHTLGASGISNLIRGTMAMKTGVFPGTLNYEHPDPDIGLEGSGLVIPTEPTDWNCGNGHPRRLQVNAFGFGGSNYVVQMEQAMDDLDTVMICPDRISNLGKVKGAGHPAIRGISFFRTDLDNRSCRMAVVAQSDEEALTVIRKAAVAFAEDNIISPKTLRSLAQQRIFISPDELPAPPLAFVFPGQGVHYQGMGRNLYESFPVIKEWMDRAASAADFDLLHLLFNDQEENLQKTRWQQPALFVMEHAIARYLTSLGINPVAMAGHSLGELTALCLAGVYSVEDGFKIVNMRARCMDKVATGNMDPGVMCAVDAPMNILEELLQKQKDIYIGNINSPRQIVLSGSTAAIRNISKILKEKGYRATLLPVSMAFHSPVMNAIHDELEAFVATVPFHAPQIPVLSNTTMSLYPSDPVEIKKILMAHLSSTVHWMENVQSLWHDHGVRLFVEAGPGDIVSNLIADTLAEPNCIQTCLPSAESDTFKTALSQLYVHGHLKVQGEPEYVPLTSYKKASAPCRNIRSSASSSAAAVTSGQQYHMEAVIRIIMDATGFNMDEIQPDMNLRRDLAIRSSRLPIIMDAAERQFGITIEMEDFIHVRTVRDIAEKISEIALRQGITCIQPASTSIASDGEKANPEDLPLMERLIRIIMDATGFEREEISPEMDLRKDLSIRSSRLPIIMDAAESQFGITIELEDFIGARTVKDIGQRISDIIVRQGAASPQPAGKSDIKVSLHKECAELSEVEEDLKRLVCRLVPMELSASAPIELSRAESIILLSPEKDDAIAGISKEIFRQDFGVDTVSMQFMQKASARGAERSNILTDKETATAVAKIEVIPSLAGLIIDLTSARIESIEDVSPLLKELFLLVKAFLKSPEKKFVLLLHSKEDIETPGRLLTEGLLGLFLSAAQEHSSVQFRTLEIGKDTDLREALRRAMDRGYIQVEMAHLENNVYTSEWHTSRAVVNASSSPILSPGDVIVISGGATGISFRLALSLVPFMPRLVFLGRTSLDSGSDRAKEIERNLADLHAAGIDATYQTCNVADHESVRTVMSGVLSRFGRIDGLIHGAGVLRDSLISQMTAEDFSTVTDIKFLGAWHLFSNAETAGLRFFIALSSVASIQGNIGQTNYAAANRMMSGLLSSLGRKNSAIRFKALMLPPIEGAGMAEDPEVRALLKRKGVGYIHANELSALFCQELSATEDDVQVMFMRKLPLAKTALINDITDTENKKGTSLTGELAADTLLLRPDDFPMIEGISRRDIRRKELEAFRTFSLEKDLWITDHKPFKFIQHPLLSAVMIAETFMEAAKILFPHLQVRGLRQLQLMDMIQCPAGVPRTTRISCHSVSNGLREVLCEATLSVQEISPSGRLTDRFIPHCKGQVILDGGEGDLGEMLADFPVRPDELKTKPMDHKKVLTWYKERSGLYGRYRVIDKLEGAGPNVVRGRTTYRETADFAHLRNARYQYSPYLLEALLQLAGFQAAAMAPSEQRVMIPLEIGEMRFTRKCEAGEQLLLEARIRTQDEEGLVWDGRALDDKGQTIMQIADMRMHWGLD